MSRIRRSLRGLSWICVLTVVSGTAFADGLVRDGVGPISTGRGGTNIAHSDNSAIILDNPAGMANFDTRHYAEFGIDTVIPVLHYTDPQNNTNNSTQPFPIPQFAYYFNPEDQNWAAGIGFFAPAGYTASYMMDNPIFGPNPTRYRSMGAYAKILPGLAFKVTDSLSIGAGLGLGVTRIELDGPFFLQSGQLAGIPAVFDMSTTGAALIWNLGLQYKLSEQTTIGLAYNSDASFDLKGDIQADIYGVAPVPISTDANARLRITWPQSLGLGIKHCFAEQHRASCDVIWYGWGSAFDDMTLRLQAPSNPLVGMLAGSTVYDTIPLNWTDTVSVRLGYEFFATPVDTWRFGYVYHPSPVPANTLNPYLDGILEHAGSLGYSRRLGTWLLNFAYQYSWGPTREVGESLIVGGDYDNSTLKAQAHWINISASKTF